MFFLLGFSFFQGFLVFFSVFFESVVPKGFFGKVGSFLFQRFSKVG